MEHTAFLNGHDASDGLVQLALEDVQKSGLLPETLEKAQVLIFSGKSELLKQRLGFQSINGHNILKTCRLIEFPNFVEDGSITSYCYKLIPSLYDNNQREIKYLHAKDRPAIPYIPADTWGVKKKINIPIWITEGQKKALKICQHKRYAIALLGVWNFKAGTNSDFTGGDKRLWAELEVFEWQGRTVYLGFDVDLWTNPQVRYALYELAFKLFERGAIVMIPSWQGAKGIDDFLAMQSDPVTALKDLEAQSKGLFEFMEPGHRHEIIRALKLVENEMERAILTKAAAKAIGISLPLLRKEIEPQKTDNNNQAGKSVIFEDPEPWPDPVCGGELLAEISGIITRYCVMPKFGVEAISLWILLTYTHDAAQTLALLVFSSAEMRCGKTTVLSILAKICYRSLVASNISPSAIFRSVEKWNLTLIIDEVDSFISEELRGILNSGHTRSTAFVIRNTGDDHEPRQFSTWGCKAIGLIGKLPSTLVDRSLTIRMFRKKPGEKVDRLRLSNLDAIGQIRSKCVRWAQDNLDALKNADPSIPDGLNDRAADNWTPLLAIADLIGGEWPDRAREAAMALSAGNVEDHTLGVMLLEDIKKWFEENETDRILSSDLISYLSGLEERPWSEFRKGKAITPRQVARLLQPFDVLSNNIRIGNQVVKGYKKQSFLDAFDRYLPNSAILCATPPQPLGGNDLHDNSIRYKEEDVADKNLRKPLSSADCSSVADKKGDLAKENLFSYKNKENVIEVLEILE